MLSWMIVDVKVDDSWMIVDAGVFFDGKGFGFE